MEEVLKLGFMEITDMKNICEVKKFANFKASGLSLITENLRTFLNCEVLMQLTPVAKFEEHFNIDIHTNINRYCYHISENMVALIIKIYGKVNGSIEAVLPIVLVGENIACIENSLFESLAKLLSKRMTECRSNSFHGGTSLFGDDFIREAISKCLVSKQYDFSRIMYLVELFEKLASITFEGNYFTTGLILSRSLYEYCGKNGEDRKGKLRRINKYYDILKKPSIDKRFWYLIDGVSSFYLMDQTFIIKQTFTRDEKETKLIDYFDFYFLDNTLMGGDIAFRVIGPNEVSIITKKGYEFIKIEGKWRIRNFAWLDTYLANSIELDVEIRRTVIYYVTLCAQRHCSAIIWIPKDESESEIDKVISSKNKIWKDDLDLIDEMNKTIIQRIISSDGVTIINKKGKIIYCGAIVKLNVKKEKGLMGTGENAAKILGQNGVAIKISQDGDIKIFTNSLDKPTIY